MFIGESCIVNSAEKERGRLAVSKKKRCCEKGATDARREWTRRFQKMGTTRRGKKEEDGVIYSRLPDKKVYIRDLHSQKGVTRPKKGALASDSQTHLIPS